MAVFDDGWTDESWEIHGCKSCDDSVGVVCDRHETDGN